MSKLASGRVLVSFFKGHGKNAKSMGQRTFRDEEAAREEVRGYFWRPPNRNWADERNRDAYHMDPSDSLATLAIGEQDDE